MRRRIPLSRRSHVTGFQTLATGVAEHESALERDFVTLVNWTDAGALVTEQPVTIRFRQVQRSRRYTPDFRVDWSAGGSDIVEIKYRADLRSDWHRLGPAFAAARAWAGEHGMAPASGSPRSAASAVRASMRRRGCCRSGTCRSTRRWRSWPWRGRAPMPSTSSGWSTPCQRRAKPDWP